MIKNEGKVSLVIGEIGVSADSIKTCKATLKNLLQDPLIRNYLQISQLKKLNKDPESYIG